jgi:hypothetical protein
MIGRHACKTLYRKIIFGKRHYEAKNIEVYLQPQTIQ